MKQLVIFIVFIFCCKIIFAQQTAPVNTYALVIGVAKYLYPEIPQLQFANRDATIFADFLKSKAGGSIPNENIRLLIDEAATSAAVVNGIYWLKNASNKGDKVYIYFSGHGDLENITMYKNGFLICFDSPPSTYVNLALSIDFLNDMANTISIKNQATVIMITDACHSGKMTEKVFKGNFLAGNQLRTVLKNEIRITSSAANQLSNEKADWGEGRGVFSYYLINGLSGLALKANADKVTLDDIKIYLDSSLKNDLVLKRENTVQTPVVSDKNGNFVLALLDTAALIAAKKEVTEDTFTQRRVAESMASAEETTPEQYFYNLLKQYKMEDITDSFSLNEIPAERIPFVLIDSLINQDYNESGRLKLQELKESLSANKESLTEFKNTLATTFDEAGQRVITEYLRGDAAELEKRRYYHVGNGRYYIYMRMYEVALKLISPDKTYYYNNLQVKLHYFTGVVARLEIVVTADRDKRKQLIEAALFEQKKALALEVHAAYIYNELGILYTYKKDLLKAAANFREAATRAPNWAIPYSNLAELYAGNNQLEKARLYIDTAKSLEPGLQNIYDGYGVIHEKNKNLLQAEEAFQKSIKLNRLNYLPFERLGFLYMNTNKYAAADSFLFEAEERKKGYYFEMKNHRNVKIPKTTFIPGIYAITDPAMIAPNDMVGHFALGYQALRDEDLRRAEGEFRKVIALDKTNPLVYHYLGRTMFEQQRWQEAELILKLAMNNYLDYLPWLQYSDSVLNRSGMDFLTDPGTDSCFRYGYYNRHEDFMLLAQLYQNWGHYYEAENYYFKFIESDSAYLPGYIKLATLYENTGRYNEAEMLLNNYYVKYHKGLTEVLNFYNRVTKQVPENGEWFLKAGLFQYAFAQKDPDSYLGDTKTIDPFTGEVTYANTQKSTLVRIPDPMLPRIIPYGTIIPYKESKANLKPFTDGIYFLEKSLATLPPYDEKLLAGINAKIGDLFNWQGLPDSAAWFYEAALELNADDAGTRNKLVETLSKTYRFSEALVQLDSLSNRKELNFDKQLMLAKYKLQDNQIEEAGKLEFEAEIINPSFNMELTELKARLLTQSNYLIEAIEIYKELYKMNNKDSITLYNIARLYALSGNNGEARKWLELALKAGFNYKNVLLYDTALKGLRKEGDLRKWLYSGNDFKEKIYNNSDFTRWDNISNLSENAGSTFQ